ncbi:MAG: hypothetical protein ACLFU0_10645 [Alphaproteobacteria bacterium]
MTRAHILAVLRRLAGSAAGPAALGVNPHLDRVRARVRALHREPEGAPV